MPMTAPARRPRPAVAPTAQALLSSAWYGPPCMLAPVIDAIEATDRRSK